MKKRWITFIVALAAFAGLSAAQPAPVEKQTFVYAVRGADTLRLDKYDIPGEGAKPCVIFMFGGGFSTGTRDEERYVDFFEFLAREGFVAVSIDYRLGFKNPDISDDAKPKDFLHLFENTIKMAVEDLYSATCFVLDSASGWGVEPDAIVACGSSAGAISVLQGEYERANRTETAQILPEGFRYAGVISFAGAIYSDHGHLKWESVPAPLLLFHGDADQSVPYGKIKVFRHGLFGSKYIAERYRRNGFPYWLYTAENSGHEVASSPMSSEREEIMSFLRKYVVENERLQTDTTVKPLDKPEVKKRFGLRTYRKSNFGRGTDDAGTK